jgi:hypothetical protein
MKKLIIIQFLALEVLDVVSNVQPLVKLRASPSLRLRFDAWEVGQHQACELVEVPELQSDDLMQVS